MKRVNESTVKDLVFTFVTIPGEVILERGRVNFRSKTLLKLKKFEETIESHGVEYGKLMLDIDEFLYDENFQIPVYIQSTGKITSSDRNKLSMFIRYIDDYEMYVRETILAYYERNKEEIEKAFYKMNTKTYADMLKGIHYDLESIDNICDLAYVIIEKNYMGIGIATYWSDAFLEIPVVEHGRRAPLTSSTRAIKLNGDDKVISVDEITTFRDLEERPDLGMVITHGNVRAFFGKKTIRFPVWLLRTYDISELQEKRFQEFQKSYSYYSNLIAESLTKYFSVNYLNIIKDSPEMGKYDRNISKKVVMKMLNLSRVEISSDGSMYVIITTDWGEEITVQIWNKDVKLTNYFALPIVGNKYGHL